MAFDPVDLIFIAVGVVMFILLVFGGCVCYRVVTNGSMGTLQIVRDEKGEVIAMKTTL